MNEILFNEIYQFLFVVSTIYFSCIVLLFVYRFIRSVFYNINTTMQFEWYDKLLILISLSISISYLI